MIRFFSQRRLLFKVNIELAKKTVVTNISSRHYLFLMSNLMHRLKIIPQVFICTNGRTFSPGMPDHEHEVLKFYHKMQKISK